MLLGYCCLVMLSAAAHPASQIGPVYPIKEPDLLQVIQQKLHALKASGQLAALQQHMKKAASERLASPPPVEGLGRVSKTTRFTTDLHLRITKTIRDMEGHLIVKAGQVIYPLERVTLRQPLLVLDGRDAAQRAWAKQQLQQIQGKAKLILTGGRPFELMKQWHTRVYFDQGGELCKRLGITAVPALVVQQGKQLVITEEAVS